MSSRNEDAMRRGNSLCRGRLQPPRALTERPYKLVVRILLVAGTVAALARNGTAQTMKEYSAEARFQLDLHVPDAALMTFIPSGFTLNVATQGAAKDANLRAV